MESTRAAEIPPAVQSGDARAPESFRERFSQMLNPAFGWLFLLLFLYSFGVDTATFFDPILEERFSGEFLGRITTAYYVGILAGIFLFPLLKGRLGMKTVFGASARGLVAG